MSEPLIDRRNDNGGFVTDGELVVPGRHGTLALETVDPALHGVTLLVDLLVERRSATSTRTAVLAVADLVGFLRNSAPDAPSPQVGAIGARTVGLVRQHPVRTGPRPTPTGAGNTDPFQDSPKL